MGTAERREREKQWRRQQIMDAAKKVFSSCGVSSATMESIAKEAELSPATLYLYFRNKDELYASLNLKMLQLLIEKLEGVHDSDAALEPEEKIRAMENALYEVYENDPLNLINVLRFQASDELSNISAELAGQIKEYSGKALRTLARVFEEGIGRGRFHDHSPTALADIVWAVFSGLVLWEESKKGFDPEKDYLKSTLGLAIEVINRGISRT